MIAGITDDSLRAFAERLVAKACAPLASLDERRAARFAATGYADLEAAMEADDIRREDEVVRCVMHANRLGLGLSFSAADAAILHRAMKRHGMVP